MADSHAPPPTGIISTVTWRVRSLLTGVALVFAVGQVWRNRRWLFSFHRQKSLEASTDAIKVGDHKSGQRGHAESANSPASNLVKGNFVLLAPFDGIRGCSVALRGHGVEPCADYSSELDPLCQKVIRAKFPDCIQLGDVNKVSKDALERIVAEQGRKPWLVVGGSPCQDLSIRRGPKRKGLCGKKSKLFFEFVRIVNTLMNLGVEVAFLLENVASMEDEQRDAISSCLGVDPVRIDSAEVSACHRARYYWTNLPVTPIEPKEVDIDALLDEGWHRDPPGKPFRCFVASAVRGARWAPGGVRRASDGEERVPNANEREAMLGFPRGHTQIIDEAGEVQISESVRLRMLGNSFSVQVIAHLLTPFAEFAKGLQPLSLRPLRQDALLLSMNRVQAPCDDEEHVDMELFED